jgi:vacuolar-type H+-ATPase subunit E/Vma4
MDVINILELSARESKQVIGEVHTYKVRKKEKVETIDMKVKPMLANIVKALKKERELVTNEVMLLDIKQKKLREIKELLDLIREKCPDYIRGLSHTEEVLKAIFKPPILAQLKSIIETRYNSLHRDENKYNDLSGRSLSNAQ